MIRIGQGFDVHRFTDGKSVILCGVEIEHDKKLEGWSDADCPVHALMDAMLGAASLGDIGRHFPDSDPAYRGISSLLLLEQVRELLRAAGWTLGNLDVTVIAQAPKLAGYLEAMERKLADALAADPEQINIKATTEERLGFTGRSEGIAAHAVALIEKSQ